MKKINNSGFLLVETVIVSVLVLTIFVLVYQNLVPAIGEYEKRIRYDDIDSVYAANSFKNILINDDNFKTILEEVDTKGYKDLTDCTAFSNDLQGVCQALKEEYGIKDNNKIVVGHIPLDRVLNISNLPRGFVDYVKYINASDPSIESGYTVMISRSVTFTDARDGGKKTTINRYANIQL